MCTLLMRRTCAAMHLAPEALLRKRLLWACFGLTLFCVTHAAAQGVAHGLGDEHIDELTGHAQVAHKN